jgi:tetratricopeptide (TPR) repeat protein
MANAGSVIGEVIGLMWFGFAASQVGAVATAEKACADAFDKSTRGHYGYGQQWSCACCALMAARGGAVAHARELLATLQPTDAYLAQFCRFVAAQAYASEERFDLALQEGLAGIEGPSPAYARWGLGLLAQVHVKTCQPEKALRVAEQALAQPPNAGFEVDSVLLLARAEALEQLGDRDRARAAIGEARGRISMVSTSISDPALRESFMRVVEPHARTLDLADEWLGRQ